MNNMSDSKQTPTKIKITLVGDPNVGKTTFASAYIASSEENNLVQSKIL